MSMLLPEEAKLFDDLNFVSVATLGKDGTPRSAAIWVDRDGDDILLNGASSRQWIANLRRNPHVALNIFDQANPYNQVNVIGEVVEITAEGAEAHIDKLAQKYTGANYRQHQADDPRLLLRVRATKVVSPARLRQKKAE